MQDDVKRPTSAGEEEASHSSNRLMTIGQVVAELQPDFPDLTITKVRYLEDRQLLAPARSKGRYRKYGTTDVRRLRAILTLQRDEYLPLEVIRGRIDRAGPSGLTQSMTSVVSPLRSNSPLRKEDPVYTLAELRQQSGVDEAFLQLLVEYRLIEPIEQGGAMFTESDAEIARICQVLARFGVEPRNLRLLGSSVEREAAILGQVVTPSLRSTHPDKRDYGEKTLGDLGALYSQLMHLLLYRELRNAL